MKEITKTYNGFEIKVVIDKGTEYFNSYSACKILNIQNPARAVQAIVDKMNRAGLDGDGIRRTYTIETPDGYHKSEKIVFVNEQGLYELIFNSGTDEAVKFRAWVTGELLPSIRKTGKYDIRDIRGKSAENRNLVTGGWQRQGVSKPWEYGGLTRAEYQELFGNPDIKKSDMDRSQIIALAALESVEALKLDSLPPETLGYRGCETSLKGTAIFIDKVRRQGFLRDEQENLLRSAQA
jgi:prophage antirepressor-like protein